MRHEPYATKQNADGTTKKYWSKAAYDRGRQQAAATMAAQRSRINNAVGGNVV